MIKYKASAVLFSRKNYDCVLTLKNICEKYAVNLMYEIDFLNFVKKVVISTPDFILIDGSSMNFKNFPYHLLTNKIFQQQCKIIILTENFVCENAFVDVISLNKIDSYINNNILNKEKGSFTFKYKDFSNYINNFLSQIGFLPKYIGKNYLRDCINLILNEKANQKNLTKDCYSIIALNNNTKMANIERNIRNAIQKAYNNGAKEIWEEYFQIKFDKIPSNRSFVFLCVDKITEIENLNYI